MEQKKPTRYLVTYRKQKVDLTKASSILGVARSRCKHGVSFMGKEATPKKDDVIHFENLVITSIELNEEERLLLAGKKEVLAIEEDIDVNVLLPTAPHHNKNKPVQSTTSPPNKNYPWNMNMVKVPEAWERGFKGKNVKVAVLDTGIANHHGLVVSGGASFVDGVSSYDDGHSHGTHVAGIIGARGDNIDAVGVAPMSDLYAVKVLRDTGSGLMSWVIAGLEWCINNKIHIANLSLGSPVRPRIAYASAIEKCQDNGITIIAAAGNSGNSAFPYVGSPANSYLRSSSKASPIAVGSVDQNSYIDSSSSRGSEHNEWNVVTVVAPGVRIRSTVLNNEYALNSGTSMACPHVSGLAALIYEKYPGISPINVARMITITATYMGNGAYQSAFGSGLINCDKATL